MTLLFVKCSYILWRKIQSRGGEIGRRRGFKIPRSYDHAGSIPALGTKRMPAIYHLKINCGFFICNIVYISLCSAGFYSKI